MMIHAKLLPRRLAWVPWLLAIGLALVELTATPVAALELTATPNVIREDAGGTEIVLEVSLDYVPTADTEVWFTIADSPSGDSDFDEDTEVAKRDEDYAATLADPSFLIPAGETGGMTTLNIFPLDNSEQSLAKVFTVTASVGGTRASTGIKIADDETPTTEIWLAVNPNEVYEGAGATEVTVTGTLNGRAFDADTSGLVAIDYTIEDAAIRDLDYVITIGFLSIPAGNISSSTTISVTALEGGDKKIGLTAVLSSDVDVEIGTVPITLKDAGLAPPEVVSPDTNAEDASFVLSASPSRVSEEMEEATIRVTATLNGGALSSDVTVNLSIDPASTAEEDEDYEWDIDDPLVIRAGSTSGSTEVFLEMEDDGESEGRETIILNGSAGGASTVSSVEITLTDTAEDDTPSTPTDPTKLAFADTVADQEYTVGTTITELVLPAATGGMGDLAYFISTLPAGLSFDPATRTISGTPTQATAAIIIYTVIDTANAAAALSFSITVYEAVVPPPSADANLTVTPSSVREDAGTTEVELAVTLAEARATDETVIFTIGFPSGGQGAVRDVDYNAFFGSSSVVSIPAGETIGKTTLTLTPVNNTWEDGLRVISVYATFDSGATLMTDLKIVDDETTASTAITLAVTPSTVSEDTEEATITVTATLDGKALAKTTSVVVVINSTSTADRDVDYSVEGFSPWIEIPAGSTVGSMQFKIHPTVDNEEEGNETIKLTGSIDGLMADEVEITLTDPVAEPATPDASDFAFVADVENQTYTAGTAITPLVLPPAEGGTGTITYVLSLSSSLSGLSFDPATRTISGTPSAATDFPALVLYAAFDEDNKSISLLFFITVNEPQLSSLGFADTVADQEYTVGEAITPLVLPEARGGTGALTYVVSSLPYGLSFDPATRTISGTPLEVSGGAFPIVYTVVDGGGKSAVLTFTITVNPPQTVSLAFAADAEIDDQEYTIDTAITPLVLPAATGGTGALTYAVSSLPTGLVFDPATRTLSGTPTAATDGAFPVAYQVMDENGQVAVLTFNITVNKKLTFDLSDLFGSGKVVPTAVPDGATLREFVVGQRVDGLVLPAGSGGSAPLTYSLSPALPVGLTFDAATRTIAGTPQAASEAVYTYTVTDANGASASLSLQTLPAAFSLADNFPNPFNPATTIQYALPTATDMELTVYNVVGQPVRTLVAEHQSAGRYTVEWDATNDSGHSLSAGLYFYRLQAGGEFAEVKKMLLLK